MPKMFVKIKKSEVSISDYPRGINKPVIRKHISRNLILDRILSQKTSGNIVKFKVEVHKRLKA